MSLFHDSDICRSILESLPAGLCVVDMQKKIVIWSDGAERVTGHLRHDVIGHSCISETLLHCDQPGCEFCKEDCPVARAIKTSHPTESIGFLHHKAGYEIPVRVRAVPVHNQHGSIVGAVETFEELQQTAAPIHRDGSLTLPGCIDEVTDVASHALMLSHLRRTLATFVEVQVPFAVLSVRLEGLPHFRASLGPRRLPPYYAWSRVPSKARSGPQTSSGAGVTTSSSSSSMAAARKPCPPFGSASVACSPATASNGGENVAPSQSRSVKPPSNPATLLRP